MFTSTLKAVNWFNGSMHGQMDLVSFHHPNLNYCISLILVVIMSVIGYFFIHVFIEVLSLLFLMLSHWCVLEIPFSLVSLKHQVIPLGDLH